MFWNKMMNLWPFAISQQLYTLLDRKKQTFYVNSYDFTLLLFVAFDICGYIKTEFMYNQPHIHRR
jgi:hypothetical protein